MQGLSGIRSTTAGNLVLDAGAAYFNIDITALEGASPDPWGDAIATAIPLGATRGGSTFNRGLTIRDIEMDGKLGRVKGLQRRQSVEPVLTVNFAEMTAGNLTKALAGATAEQKGRFIKIQGGEITDAAYINNIALATTIAREGQEGLPVVIIVENVLVVESFDLSTVDEDEMVGSASFVGHFTVDAPLEEPWAIYLPEEAS